jgi:hypothetical protein
MRRIPNFVGASALCLLVSAAGIAQESRVETKADGFVTAPDVAAAQEAAKESQLRDRAARLAGIAGPNSFGIACCQITQIPAAAFHPVVSAVPVGDTSLGYLYPSAFGGTYDFWAPVILPSGVHLKYIDLYYYDTDATNDVRIDLRTETGADSGNPPAASTLVSVSSTQSAGYGYSVSNVDYRVNNNVEYDPNGAQLVLRTFFLSTSGSQQFKSVDLWWYRDVSPAPATATFPDVPTTDLGFQYIEALVASGITGGCGGGNYCPDNNVTRRQMGIFISKALGLYWPL